MNDLGMGIGGGTHNGDTHNGARDDGALTVRPLDLTDDADFEALHTMRWAALTHGRPHVVPPTRELSRSTWTSTTDGWERLVVGAFHGDEPVAVGTAQMPTEDDRDMAWVDAFVPAPHRRRGLGRAVLDAVIELLPPARTRLLSTAFVPTPEVDTHPYRRFGEAMGFRVATTETVRELGLPVTLELPRIGTGYRVETFVDGVSEPLRAGLGVLMGLLDAEAPSGDLEWGTEPISPERYASDLADVVMAGGHVVETLALRDAGEVVDERGHGEVVGYTSIEIEADDRRPASQRGTLVLGAHRGQGLGRALKVANLRAVQQVAPRCRRVRTESNDVNRAMHALNASLGFEPVETEIVLRRDR